jgi:rhodanese-related sulfurtransferase
VAAMLPYAPKVADVSNVEVAYSPPFAAAMDILNTVANVADNILSGKNSGITVDEFGELWKQADLGDVYILDCRETTQGEPLVQKHPGRWHNIPQGQLRHRLAEVPRDKKIVLMCNTGARSYEALVTLAHMGFEQVVIVEGGMAAVNAAGIDV